MDSWIEDGGRRKKKHSMEWRREKERLSERETDRAILPVPLYFQPSVKMNFTS